MKELQNVPITELRPGDIVESLPDFLVLAIAEQTYLVQGLKTYEIKCRSPHGQLLYTHSYADRTYTVCRPDAHMVDMLLDEGIDWWVIEKSWKCSDLSTQRK